MAEKIARPPTHGAIREMGGGGGGEQGHNLGLIFPPLFKDQMKLMLDILNMKVY